MKKPGQLLKLLTQYLNNKSTIDEAEELMKYFHTDDQYLLDQLIVEDLDRDLTDEEMAKTAPLPEYIYKGIQARIRPVAQVSTLWPRIVVAAAAVATIVFGIWFYTTQPIGNRNAQIVNQNDIAPGKQGATLLLANGKKIRLTDAANGEIAKEAGISVTKTLDGQIIYEINASEAKSAAAQGGEMEAKNTLSTAKGETYQVRLPDGTIVWLNAASSLTYSASLNVHGIRRVRLEGEAYFHVAKDKKHPFVVSTINQEVEVLGTQFNINSYPDEPRIKTTLLEGSVRVWSSRGKHSEKKNLALSPDKGQDGDEVVLKPGQQAELKGSELRVMEVNTADAIAWKNGEFSFNDEPLQSIMRKIARWYDVEVIYQDIDPNRSFGGTVSRFEHISKVLEKLEMTGSVKFQIKGKKVIVSK